MKLIEVVIIILLLFAFTARGQSTNSVTSSHLVSDKYSQYNNSKTWKSDNRNRTFPQPIIYNEFPDPDLIRVGISYYLKYITKPCYNGLICVNRIFKT
jgi:hypothetical protein